MANLLNHLNQAKHNEIFAKQLDADTRLIHWDWLITVSFYAAVHYLEALFFVHSDIVHTELACVTGDLHAFRAAKVRQLLGRDCWKSYRRLLDASYNVRYLGLADREPDKLAVDYYSSDEARRMYRVHLSKVRDAVMKVLSR